VVFGRKRLSNAGAATKWREKLRGLRTGFPKNPDIAGVGMPQFYGGEIATGELAHLSVMLLAMLCTRDPGSEAAITDH
jgi:hypothetical protein